MHRILFENSKAALAFAAVTLVGAALFVSSQDGSNSHDRALAVDQVEPSATENGPRHFPPERSDGGIASPEFDEWASDQPVFDDFAPDEALTDHSREIGPAAQERYESPFDGLPPPPASGAGAQGATDTIVPGRPDTGE